MKPRIVLCLLAFFLALAALPSCAGREQVPDTVKGNRFDRLLATQNAIAAALNRPLQGSTIRVLCDGESKGDAAVYSGRTEGNKIVFFKGTPDMIGRFLDVRIERAEAFALWGDVVGGEIAQ